MFREGVFHPQGKEWRRKDEDMVRVRGETVPRSTTGHQYSRGFPGAKSIRSGRDPGVTRQAEKKMGRVKAGSTVNGGEEKSGKHGCQRGQRDQTFGRKRKRKKEREGGRLVTEIYGLSRGEKLESVKAREVSGVSGVGQGVKCRPTLDERGVVPAGTWWNLLRKRTLRTTLKRMGIPRSRPTISGRVSLAQKVPGRFYKGVRSRLLCRKCRRRGRIPRQASGPAFMERVDQTLPCYGSWGKPHNRQGGP